MNLILRSSQTVCNKFVNMLARSNAFSSVTLTAAPAAVQPTTPFVVTPITEPRSDKKPEFGDAEGGRSLHLLPLRLRNMKDA